MAPQPQAADPTETPEQDAPAGYCIEVHVAADGSIKVSVEPEAEEASEEGAQAAGGAAGDAGAEDADAQPVANIREAIKLVMEIYKSQGELPDTSGDQAQMTAGYGQ
jgi:hypothetical protein